ncbi:hypothetical protein HK103_000344 [Boothiomyces macroporosus]|uniref:Uncharacterized protein n=1 Tax=Boothiomyces macroporosus TaxID=261099 RepID=A0AAD5UFI8_9FUNG|nr:hypothetical protein HK103_000344 [Boothiomyces macroporosus]
MSKIAIIAGYGTGISHAAASHFGKKGYQVALLSRTKAKLDSSVAEFSKHGVKALAFPVDLSKPDLVKKTVDDIRKIGTVEILFWNPYGPPKGALDLTAAELDDAVRLTTTSLAIATQAVLPDLEKSKGSILVTGGGLSLENDNVVNLAVAWNATTLAVAKASQRKLVHILHETLKPKGVFVGEVTVMGIVKGTAFDHDGKSTLTAESIIAKFEELLAKRDQVFATAQ